LFRRSRNLSRHLRTTSDESRQSLGYHPLTFFVFLPLLSSTGFRRENGGLSPSQVSHKAHPWITSRTRTWTETGTRNIQTPIAEIDGAARCVPFSSCSTELTDTLTHLTSQQKSTMHRDKSQVQSLPRPENVVKVRLSVSRC
jgi:hypothetical protein